MKVEHISVTEAGRNFADCINRAHYQGTTFILHKGGKAVATIKPGAKKSTKVPCSRCNCVRRSKMCTSARQMQPHG